MWMIHMEEEDNCKLLHARNGWEYILPELPHYSVDGYCAETRKSLNFWAVSFTGVNANPFATSRRWVKIR